MPAMTAVAWVLDLDGVVWLGDAPIAGAADAVARLRSVGERVRVRDQQLPADAGARSRPSWRDHGIAPADDVVTSPMAAASLVEPGERVLVCGGPGVVEASRGGRDAVVPTTPARRRRRRRGRLPPRLRLRAAAPRPPRRPGAAPG